MIGFGALNTEDTVHYYLEGVVHFANLTKIHEKVHFKNKITFINSKFFLRIKIFYQPIKVKFF